MNTTPQSSCIRTVQAYVPLPIPYVLAQMVAQLCAHGVSPEAIARIVFEMLLGADDADTKGDQERQQRERLARALLSAATAPKKVEDAARAIVAKGVDWKVWSEIVEWLFEEHREHAQGMLSWLYGLFCDGSLVTLEDAKAVVAAPERRYLPPRP